MIQPGPSASPVAVDHVYVGGYLTQGIAQPDGFAAQIRDGMEEFDGPDFNKASPRWGVLERDGLVWRNDGRGWWNIEIAPGTGFDRISAIHLPNLLRRVMNLGDVGIETVNGAPLHHFTGLADAVDWPGIIVPDGLAFTASPIEVDLWIDAAGRLVQIHGKTANLTETTFSLVAETTITFGYDNVPPIGEPTPTQPPATRIPEATAPAAGSPSFPVSSATPSSSTPAASVAP